MIRKYLEGKRIWKAKMAEPLRVRIVKASKDATIDEGVDTMGTFIASDTAAEKAMMQEMIRKNPKLNKHAKRLERKYHKKKRAVLSPGSNGKDHILEYKGYHAMITYDSEDGLFIGSIEGIKDSVNFHGSSMEEITDSFHRAVDTYLDVCRMAGKDPV